jgi:hypothetical protein
MVDFLENLWPGVLASIIASIITAVAIVLCKWLKVRRQPSLGRLKTGEWFSYYYKFEQNKPVLKTDTWKIKKDALDNSNYYVSIIDSTKKSLGKWKQFTKFFSDLCCKIKGLLVPNYTCKGELKLNKDGCYTAQLDSDSSSVFIRLLKPTEIMGGNSILRGVAITMDENNCIRSGLNIFALKKLSENKLMDILYKISNVN